MMIRRFAIVLLACLLTIPALAALNFNGTTHEVDHGDVATMENSSQSYMFVLRPTTLSSGDFFMYWANVASDVVEVGVTSATGTARMTRAYSTTGLVVQSSTTVLTVNTWTVVFLIDNGDGNNPQIFYADIGDDLVEVSYTTQTAPSGSPSAHDLGSGLQIGRRDDTRRFLGDIARTAVWGAALTIGQCRVVLSDPFSREDLTLYADYGHTGTTTATDWSGSGNAGTITGATLADHAPLPTPF